MRKFLIGLLISMLPIVGFSQSTYDILKVRTDNRVIQNGSIIWTNIHTFSNSITVRDGYFTNLLVDGGISQRVAGVTNYFAGRVGIGTNILSDGAILSIIGTNGVATVPSYSIYKDSQLTINNGGGRSSISLVSTSAVNSGLFVHNGGDLSFAGALLINPVSSNVTIYSAGGVGNINLDKTGHTTFGGNINASGVITQSLAAGTNYFAGSIGIGTNLPSSASKLHIVGTSTGNTARPTAGTYSRSRFVIEDSVNAEMLLLGTNACGVYFATNGATALSGSMTYNFVNSNLSFASAATTAMTIDDMQRVGVGTAVPAAKLDVNGGITCSGVITQSLAAGTNYFAGRVGVGITTPKGTLSSGNTLGDKLLAYDDAGSIQYGMGMQSTIMQIYCDSSADRVGIGHGTSASFTETLTVKNGQVGIGTNAPSYILEIVKGSSTDPIADSWQNHPCNRQSKHIVEESVITNYADSVAAIPIYRWQRTAETNLVTLYDSDNKTTKIRKCDIPKFKTTRVGIMLDDPQIPKEICVDGDPDKGMDLVAWIGYLQAALRDEIVARKALEARLDAAVNLLDNKKQDKP